MLINIEKTANFAFLERITSMFPILGTNLWFKHIITSPDSLFFSSTYLFQNQNTLDLLKYKQICLRITSLTSSLWINPFELQPAGQPEKLRTWTPKMKVQERPVNFSGVWDPSSQGVSLCNNVTYLGLDSALPLLGLLWGLGSL